MSNQVSRQSHRCVSVLEQIRIERRNNKTKKEVIPEQLMNFLVVVKSSKLQGDHTEGGFPTVLTVIQQIHLLNIII